MMFTILWATLGIGLYVFFGIGMGVALADAVTKPHEKGKVVTIIVVCALFSPLVLAALVGGILVAATIRLASLLQPAEGVE